MIQNFSECRPLLGEVRELEALPASIQANRSSNRSDERSDDEHNILHLFPKIGCGRMTACAASYLKLRQESVSSKPFLKKPQSWTMRELRAGNFHIQWSSVSTVYFLYVSLFFVEEILCDFCQCRLQLRNEIIQIQKRENLYSISKLAVSFPAYPESSYLLQATICSVTLTISVRVWFLRFFNCSKFQWNMHAYYSNKS